LRPALIENPAFGGGGPGDRSRDETVALELARREDDNVAGDAQAIERAVHRHNQTAACAADRKDDEKIDVAPRVSGSACLRTEKGDPLRSETFHEPARGFPECLPVDGCHTE